LLLTQGFPHIAELITRAMIMKRLTIKGNDRMWPTVIWPGSQLVVYYLGEDESDVKVRETREIDFEEFFLHLDNGGSIFVTMKPTNGKPIIDSSVDEAASELYDYA